MQINKDLVISDSNKTLEDLMNYHSNDTDWINLTLASGVSAKVAKYRVYDNILYIVINNCTGWQLGTWMSNFICNIPIKYLNNIVDSSSAFRWVCPTTELNWVRVELSKNSGGLYVQSSTYSSQGTWFDLVVSFPII